MAKYVPGHIPGVEARTARLIQQLFEMNNRLSDEIAQLRASIPPVGAKKENPIQGMINIPYRTDGGQDGFIRVNKDGVIVSYTNPTESIFPYSDITIVGNVGAGIQTLHSFNLPAGTLANNGHWIRCTYSGTFATNDNDKRIQILFDGQIVEDFGNFDFDTGVWKVYIDYVRITSTTVRVGYMGMYGTPLVIDDSAIVGGTQDVIYLPRNALITVSNLNLLPVILSVTGSATANDDITQNQSLIEYYKPRTVNA